MLKQLEDIKEPANALILLGLIIGFVVSNEGFLVQPQTKDVNILTEVNE